MNTERQESCSWPLNIATRLRVELGDKVMIAGFIITGNSPKTVFVRGIGPSLANFGLTDVLQDPILDLRNSNGSLILLNDNWKDTQRNLIEGTVLQPTDDRESVIVATLQPGAYTAILTGAGQTTGVGLVEVYDNDQAVDSQLANLSTRGFVMIQDNVMIGGFMLGGNPTPTRIAIRGIGPSLASSGLSNLLADPTLELHDKDGVIIAINDDWRSDQEAEIIATTIPPTDDAESAILATLTPDAYTAIVRGKDDTTGVALVEAYQLDN